METRIILLKNSLIIQAKSFLENAGEFYPFAAAVDQKDDVKTMGVYLENDHPSSEEVLTVLEKAIDRGLSNGDYKIAAIGLDVFLSSDQGERTSALEIRVLTKDNDVITTHIPYHEKNNKYFFEDFS